VSARLALLAGSRAGRARVRVRGATGFVRSRAEGFLLVVDSGRWSTDFARRGLDLVNADASVLTSAVPEIDWPTLERAGLELAEVLVLLERRVEPGDRLAPGQARRAGRRHLDAAVACDIAAFPPGHALDRVGLQDARIATGRHRFAMRGGAAGLHAYAVSGISAHTGYLQRLAVHPAAQRCGHGRALVRDSLAWLARHGAVTALVNTHLANAPAIALYGQCGFVTRPDRLGVFARRR